MLENSVIIFTTDNGGPANGYDFNWASNYPLRGVKASLYEGIKNKIMQFAILYSRCIFYSVINVH